MLSAIFTTFCSNAIELAAKQIESKLDKSWEIPIKLRENSESDNYISRKMPTRKFLRHKWTPEKKW